MKKKQTKQPVTNDTSGLQYGKDNDRVHRSGCNQKWEETKQGI